MNSDEEISLYFSDLSISIHNDYMPELQSFYIKSEQFHTLFDELKNNESIAVINTLANSSLKHWITPSNKSILLITVSPSQVFNFSTHLK